MIRSPLGFRLNPQGPIREQIRAAARLGAKGVVLDAVGDLAPDRLGDTGRRELRHLLRSVELTPIALGLPTRRPFDTVDQLDVRLKRAESACTLAYELGTPLVLAQVGAIPPEGEADAPRRETFLSAVTELGRRADHRGVRFGLETGPNPGSEVRVLLEALGNPGLAASLDPASLLQSGHDPVAATLALGPWVVHAYATEATSAPALAGLARRPSFGPGALDWADYLGALEEVNYRGFLTIWPDPSRDQAAQFQALAARLQAF